MAGLVIRKVQNEVVVHGIHATISFKRETIHLRSIPAENNRLGKAAVPGPLARSVGRPQADQCSSPLPNMAEHG